MRQKQFNSSENPVQAILVERNFKGNYERFALTPEEFKKEYPEVVAAKLWPIAEPDTFTLRPLVHLWFEPVMVLDDEWNRFFSDMEYGLCEADIKSGNVAYIRKDFMETLLEFLPSHIKDSKEELAK